MSDEEKKELDDLLEAANGKKDAKLNLGFKFTSEDGKVYVDSKNFDWANVEDIVKETLDYSDKDAKLAEIYGKKAQMASGYGAGKTKQWINYTKNKIYQADPRASTVRVHIDPTMFSTSFELILNDGWHAMVSISDELLHQALQAKGEGLILKMTDNLVSDIKHKIKETHPVPKIVNTNKPNYELLYNNIGSDIKNKLEDFKPILNDEEWANILKKTATEEAKKWWGEASWEKHPPMQQIKSPFPPSPPPTPPEKDKEYSTGPELEYNKAVKQLHKTYLKEGSAYSTWGNLKVALEQAIKLKEEIKKQKYELATKTYKGFNGSKVQDDLREVLPCLYQTVKCPACKKNYTAVMSEIIIHLNDEHDWTREAIADWSESLDIDISVKEKEDNE